MLIIVVFWIYTDYFRKVRYFHRLRMTMYFTKHILSLNFKRPLWINEQNQSKTIWVVYYHIWQSPEIYRKIKKITFIWNIYMKCSFCSKFKDQVCLKLSLLWRVQRILWTIKSKRLFINVLNTYSCQLVLCIIVILPN